MENKMKNYKVETDGEHSEPEFFIVTAENVVEAHNVVRDEIENKNYKCEITSVTLIDTKFRGVKVTSESCC